MEDNANKHDRELESRRVTWSYRETSDLLDICLAKNVGKIMSMKHTNKYKREVFNEVGREMNRLGHGKSLEQVIVKFKNLCQKYKKGLPSSPSPSGQFNKKRFEMWNRMHEIYKYMVKKENSSPSATASQDKGNSKIRDEVVEFCDAVMDEHSDPSDPLYGGSEDIKEDFSISINGDHFDSASPVKTKREISMDDDVDMKFLKKAPATKSDRNTANYLRCVRYLVEKFKSAQEDLQNKFYTQQLRLQQQQQEWEEKILDEEREFFAKILKSTDANSKRKNAPSDFQSEDDFGI